ncbi:hypothetical protein Bbelb_298850 [Branchiostoma belcheri]|nr:hypothetical protein Bbelb_298850 [Branchiostoma belcheri]
MNCPRSCTQLRMPLRLGEQLSDGQQPVQVFSTDGMRLVNDRLQVIGDISRDSCLNLTREDWTTPSDLKTQEEYLVTAVMILKPTRPDVRVLRNLETGNFSPVQTSKSDDPKTHTCVEGEGKQEDLPVCVPEGPVTYLRDKRTSDLDESLVITGFSQSGQEHQDS